MRYLFPLDLVLRGQRPVRDLEIDHLIDRPQALQAEWPQRVRAQGTSEQLPLAIAGLGPVIGYFVFEMPALELFLLVALDTFVLLLGDWLKYLVAPYATQLALAGVTAAAIALWRARMRRQLVILERFAMAVRS